MGLTASPPSLTPTRETADVTMQNEQTARRHRGFTAMTTYVFERIMPDAFVLAIALSVLVAVAAMLFAPRATLPVILSSWYGGLFGILGFAFQMILILVTGHVLAHAPPVQRGLRMLVSLVKTPNQAVVVTFLVAAAGSWINWGFGLVIGAVLAREIAREIRLDFAWLVAAAYSGWVIWSSGPSGSIALAQASHGNALNIVEKMTGHSLPFSTTIFTPFNLVPTLIVVAVMPFVFMLIRPGDDEMQVFTPPPDEPAPPPMLWSTLPIARKLERSAVGSMVLVAAGLGYLGMTWWTVGLSADVNTVIFLFLIAGLALHRSPVNYADAVKHAARQTGGMMLQYPIYGGIMGIMTATGLAETMSRSVTGLASAHTLPFLGYLASLVITFVVPSGGGHWAVQGPFTIPAALTLHASIPATAMGVAMGEQVADMLQPFWALPVVAIAGIGIQRVLGFTVVTFLVAAIVYGAALLLLV
jgi:short-chain fatty acids transporter